MIFESMAAAARSTGSIWHDERLLTHEALAGDALRLAGAFEASGVGRGDVVAIVLGAETAFVVATFACVALGAVAMPLNPKYGPAELSHLVGQAAPAAFVTRDARAETYRGLIAQIAPTAALVALDECGRAVGHDHASRASAVACAAEDDAVIFHSSGSTGRSKLLRRTHGQIMAEVVAFAARARTHANDVFLSSVPLFHAHGFANCMMATIAAGARLVLAPEGLGLLGRDTLAELAERHRATVMPAVPMTFDALARATNHTDLSSLRLCFSAGTGLPAATFDAFRERYGVPVRQLYGCSEAGALTLNMDPDIEHSWSSVGRPLDGVEVRIEQPDDDGVGLVVVASPSLTHGYDGAADANALSFVGRWFHTGDRGRLDDDGRLYITGKRAYYIESAGHKIDPHDIEDVLASHSAVDACAVVGIPGRWGTRLRAVVVPRSGAAPDGEALRQYCAQRLADYKVPHQVVFRDALPRSPLGKILKKYLVDEG